MQALRSSLRASGGYRWAFKLCGPHKRSYTTTSASGLPSPRPAAPLPRSLTPPVLKPQAEDKLFIVDVQALLYPGQEAASASKQAAAGTLGAASSSPQQQHSHHDGLSPPPPQLAPGLASSAASRAQHDALSLLLDLLVTYGATHLALVVDAPGGVTWRHVRWPLYRVPRGAPPTSPGTLAADLAGVVGVAGALGLEVVVVPGVDSGDVAATLAVRAVGEGLATTIVSPDKAFYQLLRPNLELLRVGGRGGGPTRMTAADMLAATGLQDPAHWADYVALAGDAHRRIPGVKGIGKTSAAQLVGAMGALDAILADLDHAPVRFRTQRYMLAHAQGRAAAALSKELATLVTHLRAPALQVPLDTFRVRRPADGGVAAGWEMARLKHEWLWARWQQVLGQLPPPHSGAGGAGSLSRRTHAGRQVEVDKGEHPHTHTHT